MTMTWIDMALIFLAGVLNGFCVGHMLFPAKVQTSTPVARNAITENAAQLAALGRRMEKAKREVSDD
jgi:hypothetical protein